MAATKATKPKPPRKPEERWYDLHKHPDGTPGGMGLSPEHHLRNRGWNGHTINEGSGRKTVQYRNQDRPDFVISYGGGTSQKPDHNFRVLYMGANTNIPKVHHTYSVAEAMNKVEELHGMQDGHTVQPMTATTAATNVAPKPTKAQMPNVSQQNTFVAPTAPGALPDANKDPNQPPIGPPKIDLFTAPDKEKDWTAPAKQVHEIPDAPAPTQTPPKIKPPAKAASTVGPTALGRAEYERRQRITRQAHNDRELSIIARRYGMDIKPDEVASYRGLRSIVAALQRAEQETWEEA